MSMGDLLVQLLLVDYPERLRSATLFCTTAVVALLERLAAERGAPGFVRFDIHAGSGVDRSSSPTVTVRFGRDRYSLFAAR
jgi:hypothetical protein